ncbi:MAG: TonB-dependent receptor [Acidobacteriota bacterium]|nr:MAG: TonB-dependent receptor [Acidobacteriota bacterium]
MSASRSSSKIVVLSVLAAVVLAASPATAQTAPGRDSSPSSGAVSDEPDEGIAGVLSGASGVRVATMCTNCNIANVTMCGQTGDTVQVWQDGLPVVGGLGAIYLLSVIPPQAIASTEIIRGAGSVLSGSEAGVGGLVLRTKVPEDDPYLFLSADSGSLSSRSVKAFGSGTAGRFGGSLIYTMTESDGSDPNDDGVFDLGEFERDTIGFTGTLTISDKSLLRADYTRYDEVQRGSKGGYQGPVLDEGEPASESTSLDFQRENIDILRQEYALGLDHRFPDGSRLFVQGRYAEREQDTADFGGQYMTVDEKTNVAELRYQRTVWNKHVLSVGLLRNELDVDGTTIKRSAVFPDGQEIRDKITQDVAFAEFELSMPHQIDLTIGLMYNRMNLEGRQLLPRVSPDAPREFNLYDRNEYRVLPRIRFGWKVAPWASLSVSAGDAIAPPRPVFERVCCGATVLGSSSTRPQVSRNFMIEADLVPRTWIRIRPALFYNDIEDYLQKVVWGVFPNYIPSYTNINYPGVTIEGGELSLEFRFFDKLSFGVQASHLTAESDTDAIDLTFLGSTITLFNLKNRRIPYIPEDQGSAFVKWDDTRRGTFLQAQAQYTGSLLLQRLNFFEVGEVEDFQPTRSLWIYNFRGEQRLWKGLSIYAGVDNISDERQDFLNDPRYEYNWGPLRGRYYYGGLSYEL